MLFDIIYKIYCLTRWENFSDPKSTAAGPVTAGPITTLLRGAEAPPSSNSGSKFPARSGHRENVDDFFFVLLLSSLPLFLGGVAAGAAGQFYCHFTSV